MSFYRYILGFRKPKGVKNAQIKKFKLCFETIFVILHFYINLASTSVFFSVSVMAYEDLFVRNVWVKHFLQLITVYCSSLHVEAT